MKIAGIIVRNKELLKSKITIDIIHPTMEWEYSDLICRRVLKPEESSFSFENVFPGRITFLRVYETQTRAFLNGLGSFWRNWVRYILNHFRFIKWTRFREIGHLFSLRKFFMITEVYSVLPLLNYSDEIEIEISKEKAQEYYNDWSPYFPCFGGDFLKHYYNCNTEEEYIQYVNEILKKYSLPVLKIMHQGNSYLEAYEKLFKDESFWIGIRWKFGCNDDFYIKPLS